jgi:hypothetical protein
MPTFTYLILLTLYLLLHLPNHLLVLLVLLLRDPQLILLCLYLLRSGLYLLHRSVDLVVQSQVLPLGLLQFSR